MFGKLNERIRKKKKIRRTDVYISYCHRRTVVKKERPVSVSRVKDIEWRGGRKKKGAKNLWERSSG